MALTTAQKQALKADIAANTATIPAGQTWTNSFAGVQVNAIPNTGDGNFTLAGWYNQQASPNFFGNYSSVPLPSVRGAISWKKLTPIDAIPTTPQLDVMVWLARATACQGMVLNLQTILGTVSSGGTLDATQAKIVGGLQDALSSVPSAAGGSAQDAGWASVQTTICRKGTYGEKVLANTTNGTGADNTHAATFVFEGLLSGEDIEQARAS